MSVRRKLPLIAAVIMGLGLATFAGATTFTTPGGSTAGGESVSASGDFAISGTTLTLTLSNTLAGIGDAGQLLTDVFFTLSSGSASLSTQTGDLVDVGAGGAVTDLGSSALGWGFGTATVNGLSGFELCTICQGSVTSGATPSEGILGPVSADGKYDNANGSIDSNKPHNPFINNTAVFVLTGLTPGVTVTNVIFSFSTTAGVNVTGGPTPPVPEPSSMGLIGLGLAAMAWVARRKSRGSNVTE